MDLIILALVNIVLTITLIIVEYVEYVRQRIRFYQQIGRTPFKETTIKEQLMMFFTPRIYRIVEPLFNQPTKKQMRQSFLAGVKPGQVVVLNISLVLLAYNLQNLFGFPLHITLALSVIFQISLYAFFNQKQVKIREAIEKKLPEILDILARVYRVHTDLRIALAEVAEHIHDPVVKTKFQEMVRLSRFGYTVEEAMEHIAKDIKSPDLDFVITSIKLNIPLGGELSYLFERTAQMIRQRKEARDEIQNLMFQSKISSVISAFLVPIIIFVSFSTSEKYQEVLIHNPTGRLVFFFCLFWWLIGVVIIHKNSRIRL